MLAKWVREIAELTKPDDIIWCDGSQEEWDRLTTLLVENGTFTRLNPEVRPNSFYCRSDPADVAGSRAARSSAQRGKMTRGRPTTGSRLRRFATFADIFDGCMGGRTIRGPFCVGPLASSISQLGVEITDSPYVGGLDADHDQDGHARTAPD